MTAGKVLSLFCIGDSVLLSHFVRIDPGTEKDKIVEKVCSTFSRMPYENLTKIIKREEVISSSSARRLPDEVISDHLRYGTGGTCFSLTAALVAVLRHFGVEAHPILANRRYGPDTHCAALVLFGRRRCVVDPGYLIHQPIPLPNDGPVSVANRFNVVELIPEGKDHVALYTRVGNDRKYRLTYKTVPVDEETFAAAWDRSFGWEMMTYPVLTRATAAEHYYLQGGELRVHRNGRTERRQLGQEESEKFLSLAMGISPHIIEQAFQLVGNGTSRSR